MRQIFIEVETEEEAYDYAPWASEIVEVEGGFMAFESITDFEIWKKQE